MKVSRGGRPGRLPVPNSPFGLCGRKSTLNLNGSLLSEPTEEPLIPARVKVVGAGWTSRLGGSVPAIPDDRPSPRRPCLVRAVSVAGQKATDVELKLIFY